MIWIASLVFSVVQAANGLPTFDPNVDWQSIETEHFYIHFDPLLAEGALRLSERVEPIYSKLTQKYHHEPDGKIHVILSDISDETNGVSTPLPYNAIYLYATPPHEDSALDHYDDWLNTLFSHEFTHTVHLDMANGINAFLRKIFGRFVIPNALQQRWGTEGLAEHEETAQTTAGRGRSPFIEMFLRTRALEGHFDSIDTATYWNQTYPYGNAAYWYGIGFYQYLIKKFGEEKIIDWTDRTSRAIPFIWGFYNFKTKDIFGTSFHRLWQEWRMELADSAAVQKEKIKSPTAATPVFVDEDGKEREVRALGGGDWNEDGNSLYLGITENEHSSLVKIEWKDSDQPNIETIQNGFSPAPKFFGTDIIYSILNLAALRPITTITIFGPMI